MKKIALNGNVDFLQDPKKKCVITCDEKLRALIKQKTCGQPEILRAIAQNLTEIKN